MHALLAAVLVLSCESDEYDPRNAKVVRDPDIALVRVEPRGVRPLKTLDFGAFEAYGIERLRVHARETVDLIDPEPVEHLELLVELRRASRTEWWELRKKPEVPRDVLHDVLHDDREFVEHSAYFRHRGVYDRPRLPPVTLVDRRLPLLRVESRYEWLASRSGGVVDFTLLIDLRAAPHDLLLVRCGREWFGGRCNNWGSAPSATMSCEWRASAADFRCESHETINVPWTTRSGSRTFWLLSDETIPPSRFDAVTYPSGRALAQAAAADRGALKHRSLIAEVGVVEPLFEISRNEILFGAPARNTGLNARFFVLRLEPARWIEIDVERLAGVKYAARPDREDAQAVLSADYTPSAPAILWQAVEIEPVFPPRRLIEVVMSEGEARAIFWLMFDRDRREGLRVAVTHHEQRPCAEQVYPPTATWLGVPDHGFPAYIYAMPAFHAVEGTMLEVPPAFCWLTGTIDWNRRDGFVVTMREAPCSQPFRDPQAATIGPNGQLGMRALDRSDA